MMHRFYDYSHPHRAFANPKTIIDPGAPRDEGESMSLITTLSRGPLAALFVLALGAGPALTADTAGEVDPDLMDRGERLYDADCAICHQRTGTGVGEAFPALAGNE